MTPEEIQLIRSTWSQVAPHTELAAELFYTRLFQLDPSLRVLFKGTDMREQGRKLTQMLAVVVSGVDRLGELVPAVEALGRRHRGYGVEQSHYATVGTALLETFEQALGDAFTPAARAAWTKAYTTLAIVMQTAMQEKAA